MPSKTPPDPRDPTVKVYEEMSWTINNEALEEDATVAEEEVEVRPERRALTPPSSADPSSGSSPPSPPQLIIRRSREASRDALRSPTRVIATSTVASDSDSDENQPVKSFLVIRFEFTHRLPPPGDPHDADDEGVDEEDREDDVNAMACEDSEEESTDPDAESADEDNASLSGNCRNEVSSGQTSTGRDPDADDDLTTYLTDALSVVDHTAVWVRDGVPRDIELARAPGTTLAEQRTWLISQYAINIPKFTPLNTLLHRVRALASDKDGYDIMKVSVDDLHRFKTVKRKFDILSFWTIATDDFGIVEVWAESGLHALHSRFLQIMLEPDLNQDTIIYHARLTLSSSNGGFSGLNLKHSAVDKQPDAQIDMRATIGGGVRRTVVFLEHSLSQLRWSATIKARMIVLEDHFREDGREPQIISVLIADTREGFCISGKHLYPLEGVDYDSETAIKVEPLCGPWYVEPPATSASSASAKRTRNKDLDKQIWVAHLNMDVRIYDSLKDWQLMEPKLFDLNEPTGVVDYIKEMRAVYREVQAAAIREYPRAASTREELKSIITGLPLSRLPAPPPEYVQPEDRNAMLDLAYVSVPTLLDNADEFYSELSYCGVQTALGRISSCENFVRDTPAVKDDEDCWSDNSSIITELTPSENEAPPAKKQKGEEGTQKRQSRKAELQKQYEDTLKKLEAIQTPIAKEAKRTHMEVFMARRAYMVAAEKKRLALSLNVAGATRAVLEAHKRAQADASAALAAAMEAMEAVETAATAAAAAAAAEAKREQALKGKGKGKGKGGRG
ncbi:hypothetical protein BV25DRAFT_1921978 [Artomyces pyxidatus]|uniref:Uncharacterized protein n=1 Tax=Artomyces pyxidatus TaxID=48021 RepID=A0ACB8SFH7_9AGAM|nr:hypothetical protein BV25DRAFT_1921978 [Artomyces pyxidatus]